jgi:hypothetical protein
MGYRERSTFRYSSVRHRSMMPYRPWRPFVPKNLDPVARCTASHRNTLDLRNDVDPSLRPLSAAVNRPGSLMEKTRPDLDQSRSPAGDKAECFRRRSPFAQEGVAMLSTPSLKSPAPTLRGIPQDSFRGQSSTLRLSAAVLQAKANVTGNGCGARRGLSELRDFPGQLGRSNAVA